MKSILNKESSFVHFERNYNEKSPPAKQILLSDHENKEKNLKYETKEVENNVKMSLPKGHQSFAEKYMLKLGHKEGKGLGKYQDGIVEPIKASKQIGKRGLGFKSVDLENALAKYDPKSEVISIDEEISWLHNRNSETLGSATLESWIKIGQPQRSIKDNSLFCPIIIIEKIMSSKNLLNNIGSRDLKNGRKRANPFESISQAIFINRAATKMANMDAISNWMFTEPRNQEECQVVDQNNLLYFADVCAGPGGFSEYIFFRKKWRAKGFGFTLRNHNDFMLNEFCAGPSETFDPQYGVCGDGDIYIPENIISFRDHVFEHTEGKGVHFMMADGGLQIDENFNDQEFICKKLYLCQCLMALLIVRTNGHFVVKLFDLFTSFSVGLLYLMYRSFQAISIIKPNTSRPANSERYLICKFKREDCRDIANYLFEINKKVPKYEEKGTLDVLEIVSTDVLKEDVRFFDYITSSNMRLGQNQIVSLIKLAAFCEDGDLKDDRQQELRKKCLEKWKIPDEARAQPKKSDPSSKCVELLGDFPFRELENSNMNSVNSLENFKSRVLSILDWRFVIINGTEEKNSCRFYLGLGRNNIWEYACKGWKKLGSNINGLCLPANTLLYGELVEELIGEGKAQTKSYAFHIIDGLILGGEDVRTLPLKERWKLCELFAKALHKKTYPVRVKKHYKLIDFDSMRKDLVFKLNKSSASESLCFPLNENLAYKVGGTIFFRDTKDDWHRQFSNRWKAIYFHNSRTNDAVYEARLEDTNKEDIYGKFIDCFWSRLIWWWDLSHSDERNSKKMHINDLSELLKQHH